MDGTGRNTNSEEEDIHRQYVSENFIQRSTLESGFSLLKVVLIVIFTIGINGNFNIINTCDP